MALDLVNFGFTADTSSLSQAVKDIDALEKQVVKTSNAMSRSGKEAKQLVDSNKRVSNSAKEAAAGTKQLAQANVSSVKPLTQLGKGYELVEKHIEKLRKQKVLLEQGFTRGSATAITRMMDLGASSQQIESFKRLRKEMDAVSAASRRTTGGLLGMATIARQLIPTIGAVGLAASFAQLARELVLSADAMTQVSARVNLVRGAYESVTQITNDLVDISKQNRVDLETTSRLYVRLVPALRGFATNQDEANRATERALKVTSAFGAALLVSGANTQEAIAATIQFSQAMASGRLAGDEFRSVSEAAPAFLQALADGLGKPRAELKKLSEQQLLTTAIITTALEKQEAVLKAKSATIPKTIGQVFQEVRLEFQQFAKSFNEITGVTTGIQNVLRGAVDIFKALGTSVKAVNDTLKTFGTDIGGVTSFLFKAVGVLLTYKTALAALTLASTGLSSAIKLKNSLLAASRVALLSTAVAANSATFSFAALSTALRAIPFVKVAALVGAGAAAFTLFGDEVDEATLKIQKLDKEIAANEVIKGGLTRQIKVDVPEINRLESDFPSIVKEVQSKFKDQKISIDSEIVFSAAKLSNDAQRDLEKYAERYKEATAEITRMQKETGSLEKSTERYNKELSAQRQIQKEMKELALLTFQSGQNRAILDETNNLVGKSDELLTGYRDQLKEQKYINEQLKLGVTLQEAQLRAKALMTADAEFGSVELSPQAAANRQMFLDKTNELISQTIVLGKVNDDVGGKQKDQYAEQIKSLTILNSLLLAGVSVEEARMRSAGASLAQAKAIVDLQKQVSTQENIANLKEEITLEQQKLDLLRANPSTTQEELDAKLSLKLITQEQYDLELKLLDIDKQRKVVENQRDFEKEIAQLAVINQLLSEGFDIEVARQIAQGNRTESQIQELVNAQKLQEVYKSLNDELKASAANPFRELQDLDFSTLFGDLGNPFNSLIDGFSKATEAAFEYEQTMQNVAKSIEDALARGAISGNFEEYDKLIKDREKLEVNAAKKKQRAELQANKAILSSAKGLFKEKSTGYKVIEGMEKALFALQLANQASELAAFLVAIPTKIAGFFSVGLAASKAAIASAAIQPGPLAFVGAAAMISLMGSIGFGSGGGGSASPSNEGTGTVLGDKDAKSESIKKSIDTLASIAKIELPLTSAMLRSLRNIEGNIAGVGNLIVRQATVNGAVGSRAAASFGTGSNGSTADVVGGLVGIASALKTTASALLLTNIGGIAASVSAGITGALGLSGPVGIGIALVSSLIPAVGEAFNKVVEGALPILNKLTFGLSDALIFKPLGKLFGSIFGKTKVSVTGQGLFGKDQSLGDIILGGFDLQEYADIKIKKKGLFSSSTKRKTQFSEADELIEQQFGQILSGFARSILLAAPSLNQNLDGVLENLNNFVVKIGKINLKGLKPEEIQEKLEAVFGQQADLIAQAALGGFEDFQKVGEGYFETVVRLASGVEVARTALQRLRVTAIDFTAVANTQGDIAVEIIRDSLKAFEFSTNGFVTGFSQIIDLFDGSAEELVDLVMELRSMQDNIVAAGKAASSLSLFMIKGAGDVERLQNGLSSYFDDFLTESEQAAELTRRMTREFDALGLTVPTSIQGFKDLVNSIDTSTESGQELFGAVIALAPAFKELDDALAGVLPRGELLIRRFSSLESRFLALGVAMPNTGNELEALITKLQKTDGSVIDLSDEFGILTQANQRLSAINSDVATKTDSLSSKFSAMGIELPKTRQEFDRLILNLRDQQGSSTSLSLAVESLSTEFNALMISTKNQEAASQAAQLAAQQAASAGQSQATATGSLSNQVRALSSDFYNFQIALAEFGGEAGRAIQGLFEALFSSRSSVAGDISKITGSDKLTMTPNQISAALSGVETNLPSSSALVAAISQKLTTEGALQSVAQGGSAVSAAIMAEQQNITTQQNARDLALQQAEFGIQAFDKIAKATGSRLLTTEESQLSLSKMSKLARGVGSALKIVDGRVETSFNYAKAHSKSGSSLQSLLSQTRDKNINLTELLFGKNTTAEDIFGVDTSAFDAVFGANVKIDKALANIAASESEIARLLDIQAASNMSKAELEQQLSEVTGLVAKEQDNLRKALQEFALDAEKNVKRVDKLRQETVRYYEAQKQLSDLMQNSATRLSATLKGIRDSQLSPLDRLDQMEQEFTNVYAKALTATGVDLVNYATEMDALIKPLLDQAALVYASGSEANNIRDFVLGAGDEIVKRLEELKPTGYEEESIALLNQIDETLFSLEESAFEANKLLIAAIDLSRVQTVAELEQITRVLGGSPVEKSNLITPFAKGGAFTNSVVNVPTVAPMAMFGEAGAEAIMPLSRSSDGSLGVRIVGGMGSNSVVERNTQETNRQLEALVRLQQAANQKMIEKLSEMEERLEGMEQAERLKASA